jgi:probable HAF family extracellular repeat protein
MRSRPKWILAMGLATLCGSAAFLPTAHAQQLPVAYKITDLGTLGGDYSFGRSLNEANQVVGGSYISPSTLEVHPFLYDPSTGSMTDLGVLGNKPYAYATGINNAGEVAGTVYSDTFGTTYRAFLYSNHTMIDLGVVPGSSTSAATCINDAGHVFGGLQPGIGHSFVYRDRTMVDLSPGLEVNIDRVNNAGESTGLKHATSGGDFHAFLYSDSVVTDLGTLGGSYSEGMDINAAAHVTGWSYLPDNWIAHAFLHRNGAMTDLGTLPGAQESEAIGLNDLDQAVGDSDGRAVIFSNGQIADLTNMIEQTSPLKPYVTLTQAWDINDHGWIVVDGLDSRFTSGPGPLPIRKRTHAYLLEPVWP